MEGEKPWEFSEGRREETAIELSTFRSHTHTHTLGTEIKSMKYE